MTTSLKRRHPLDLGLPSAEIVGNPMRRGPVVVASDGTSESGAPMVVGQLIASRLGLPLEVVTVLESSLAAKEIARVARESSATMVVVGSAPRRRFGHVMSGQRASQVLHAARCPVLSIPPTFSALPRSIVAAVDFGPSSIQAAQTALLVAGEDSTVVLTHVLARPVRISALSIISESDVRVNTHALFDLLLEDIATSIPDGVNVKPLVITDDPVDGILHAAADMKADLIALGTHGPGRIARLFVGSVTQTIMHHAEQAVLACPPPRRGHASAKPASDDPPDTESTWSATLDAFTERNLGRTATLELRDPNVGPHVTGHGYTFLGATYESTTHRVTIMVGDSDRPTQHLTRSVPYPDAVTIRPAPSGDGEVLEIRHGQGYTIVTVVG